MNLREKAKQEKKKAVFGFLTSFFSNKNSSWDLIELDKLIMEKFKIQITEAREYRKEFVNMSKMLQYWIDNHSSLLEASKKYLETLKSKKTKLDEDFCKKFVKKLQSLEPDSEESYKGNFIFDYITDFGTFEK